jgi:hypothetical protein
MDASGVLLAATAIMGIPFGVNNMRHWGCLVARPGAPFDVRGVAPAPVLMGIGVARLAAFVAWWQRRAALGRTPLIALEVIDAPLAGMTAVALCLIVGMEGASHGSVPLSMQIVRGLPAVQTAIALMPSPFHLLNPIFTYN